MLNVDETKTPITLLYEYAILRKLSPRFEVVSVKYVNRKPLFTVSVTVGSLSEEACAMSKKSAKHHAATKLLKKLNITSPCGVTEAGAYELEELTDAEVNLNYVGNLKLYCLQHRYPEAKYLLEEEDGPPHRKVFKMICSVSQLQEFGISRTKKLAKQKAARKMIERLQKIHGDEIDFKCEDMDDVPDASEFESLKPAHQIPEVKLTDEEIFEKYTTLPGQTPGQTLIPGDPVAYYKDHYKAYVSFNSLSPTLSTVLNGEVAHNHDNAYYLIKEIANELRVSISVTELNSSRRDDRSYVALGLSVVPSICGIGKDSDYAALDLLESMIVLCSEEQ